ncbi:MAG: tRNA (cytidine(34)-2'-O)-methyltransferase [Oligoflexales bacterium]
MRKGHPHICLFQPEIPQNTGNISRLCAATASRLHIIRPLGFSTEDRNLRRPGLDYWPFLDLELHSNIEELFQIIPPQRAAFLSTHGQKSYTEIPPEKDLFIFGQETAGLPKSLHDQYPDSFYTLPMHHPNVRSLNLANAVSIVTYHHLSKLSQASE